jgi:hypothetical protein
MSESIVTTAKLASMPASMSAHNSAHTDASDLRMLAQVEKWMAMIREINRDQQSQPAFQR